MQRVLLAIFRLSKRTRKGQVQYLEVNNADLESRGLLVRTTDSGVVLTEFRPQVQPLNSCVSSGKSLRLPVLGFLIL